jgi:hypothetical protein
MCVKIQIVRPSESTSLDPSQTPTGFLEIVSDDFPLIFLWRAVTRNYDEGS